MSFDRVIGPEGPVMKLHAVSPLRPRKDRAETMTLARLWGLLKAQKRTPVLDEVTRRPISALPIIDGDRQALGRLEDRLRAAKERQHIMVAPRLFGA